MTALLRAAAAAALLLAAPVAPAAQTVLVRGTVSDDGGPVRLARVTLQAGDAAGDTLAVAFTDADGEFAATVAATSGEGPPEATAYGVGRPFPNPAGADRVTLRYTTPSGRPEAVQTDTYTVLGRRVPEGASLAAGVYLARLRFADGSVSRAQRFVVAQAGVRVVAEHTTALPDAARPPATAAPAKTEAPPIVFLTVERAGYVTETETVDAAGGADVAVTLDAAPAPTARIAPPATVQAGAALTLDGSASTEPGGDALAYSWSFGDGGRGGTARVAHVYTAPGTYTVSLTVQGAFGATDTATAEVTVTDPPDASGATPVTVAVEGVSGAAIVGAEVQVVGGAASATTDADGQATLASVPTGVPVALAVSQPGFATQRLALELPDGLTEAPFYTVVLGARQPAQTLRDAERGGEVRGAEGVRVTLPVEGLAHADGTPASGDVEVRLTPVDVSDDDELGVFPGEFAGITADGAAPLIASYGTAEYVFEQDGEELTLAPGKTATIEIPIYVADDGLGTDLAPGDPFPLWSLDEATGEWVLEGEGTVVASAGSPTGLALRAEVTHFSWWNCDVAPDPLNVRPDITLQPDDGSPPVSLPPGTPVTLTGTAGAGPRSRARTTVSAGGDNPPLLAPPGVPIVVEASAGGGLFTGEATVSGDAGATVSVGIVLRRSGVSTGGGDIAADTTFTAAFDEVGEVDAYTFASQTSEFVLLTVEATSSVRGTATLRAPDGTALGTEPFRTGATATFRFRPQADGLHTVEVTETAGIAGTYRVSLFAAPIQQAAVGAEATVTIPDTGGIAAFAFEAAAGQPLDVYLGGDSRRGVRATLFDPAGDVLLSSLALRNSQYVELAADGTYIALVTAAPTGSGPIGLVALSLRAVPTIRVGDAVAGALREGERHNYRFAAEAGDLVRAAAFDADGDPSAFVLTTRGSDTSPQPQAFGVGRLGAGVYRMEVSAGFGGAAPAYAAALNAIAPAAELPELSLGTAGRAELTGQIDQPGGLALYRLDAAGGAGLFAALTAAGPDALGLEAAVSVAALAAGETFPDRRAEPGQGTFRDFARFDPRFDAQPADRPPGLLEAFGARLPEGEAVVVAVAAGPINGTNVDAGETPTGTFALRADVAAPGAAIEVDDDLAECPSAGTRSLRAAAFAATDETTVSVCDGRYEEALSVLLLDAATVEGASRDGVVVAHSVGGFRIAVEASPEAPGLALRDLTIETNGLGAQVRGDGAAFERVTVRPGSNQGLFSGLQVRGAGARFDGVEIDGGESLRDGIVVAVPFGNDDGPTVTGSRFAGATSNGMVAVTGRGATITGNTFELTGGGAIRLSQGGGHTVTGNAVVVSEPNGFSANGLIDVAVRGPDVADTVVSDNRIETAQDGSTTISLRFLGDEARIVAERNEVLVTSEDGVPGLSAQTNRGGEVVVRSSVFAGVGRSSPILLTASGGPLAFVNNSVTATGSSSSNTRLVVVSGGTAAEPITVVNNVLAATRGVGVDASGATTLVADHNLFFGFQAPYDAALSGGPGDLVGQDPQFTSDRLEVAAGSPAVDAGASQAAFPDVPADDVDGTARPQGAAVDIGAHEQ